MSRWPAQTTEDRFWTKVQKAGPDDCWVWTASRNDSGYGVFGIGPGPRTILAHRFAWELKHGPTDRCVLHTCDTPGCCNDRHLFEGTRTDNHDDMVSKGRQARGLALPQTKLAPEDRPRLRELYATGRWTQQELADRFGISRPCVSRWVNHG